MFIKLGELKNKAEEAKKAKEARKEAWAAKGVKVDSPIGLPAGWIAEKFLYESGLRKGKPFLRFRSPDGKHKEVCTVSKAIKLHAADNGLDEKPLLEDYEKRRDEAQKANPTSRESDTKCVEAFRAKYGALERSTVAYLPGWSLDSKETIDGQVMTTYRSPDGVFYSQTRQVEVVLGKQVLSGKEVKGIDEARENGKKNPPGYHGRTVDKKVRKCKTSAQRAAAKKKRASGMDVDMGKPSLVKKSIDKKGKKRNKAKAMKK